MQKHHKTIVKVVQSLDIAIFFMYFHECAKVSKE